MAAAPKTPTHASCNHVRMRYSVEAFPTPPLESNPDPSSHVSDSMSPAPAKLITTQRARSTPPEISREHAMRSTTCSTPGDTYRGISELSRARQQLFKKKSQYFEGAFSYRETNNSAKERVAKDSVIIAEVKLNCHLESEQELLLDLSFKLSEIYRRPESCIMVSVSPDIPMFLGGNGEPAYCLTITALHSEVAPTKNKRSTHLLQEFMHYTLQINSSRGVVRFEGLTEENLARNGITTLQEIEEMDKNHLNNDTGILRTISRQRSRKGRKGQMSIFTERGKTPVPNTRAETPSKPKYSPSGTVDSKSTGSDLIEKKKVKHRKSIMSFFRRSDSTS